MLWVGKSAKKGNALEFLERFGSVYWTNETNEPIAAT